MPAGNLQRGMTCRLWFAQTRKHPSKPRNTRLYPWTNKKKVGAGPLDRLRAHRREISSLPWWNPWKISATQKRKQQTTFQQNGATGDLAPKAKLLRGAVSCGVGSILTGNLVGKGKKRAKGKGVVKPEPWSLWIIPFPSLGEVHSFAFVLHQKLVTSVWGCITLHQTRQVVDCCTREKSTNQVLERV